jgi:hypothetical protein
VVTRKKRRENKNVSIYLNNKPVQQVNNIKYLGIIIDSKLNFRDHVIHTSRKCTALLHALAKSAKQSWGIKHEELNTIYKEVILPLVLYGAPVWIDAMERKCNKIIYSRVQRLMNMKITKVYRTISYEALCILTGTIPIEINAEETATLFRITRDRHNHQLDHEAEPKHWAHPADSVSVGKTRKRNALFRYSHMEATTKTESDRESPPPPTHTHTHIHTQARARVCVSRSFKTSSTDCQPTAVCE